MIWHVLAGHLLVAQTRIEISTPNGELSTAVLEYPLRTLNFKEFTSETNWQIDTGPIVLPPGLGLTDIPNAPLLAYIAVRSQLNGSFAAEDFVDVIVETETPIYYPEGGMRPVNVFHFSKTRRFRPAKTVILCVE